LAAWGRDGSASINVTPMPVIIASRLFMILTVDSSENSDAHDGRRGELDLVQRAF
jgi:hypothetical protein